MRPAKTLMALILALGVAADAWTQADPRRRAELEQVMKDRYRLTLIGPGMLGLTGDRGSIRRAGDVVLLRRAGLQGSLDPDQPASFGIREGTAELYRGRQDADLAVGENFYVHSIQVGSDVVTLGLVSTRQASTRGGTGHLWAALSFFFPPATIAEGNVAALYRVLDQWLQPQGAYQPGFQELAPMEAAASTAPADLKPGMTREEVVAALGPPRREVSFGARTWLNYAGLIVLMEQGKLASVDRSGQPPAKVTITSEPDGADVLLDGTFVSSTPATLELPAGTYKVSVRLPGYQEWQREVKVLAASEISLRARLEK